MQDINTTLETLDGGENLSELEPVVLGHVSEVTSFALGGSGDPQETVVWGTHD